MLYHLTDLFSKLQCPAQHKLPCLYLIDSIVKNVKGDYVKLFQQKIPHLFSHIFEKVYGICYVKFITKIILYFFETALS